MKLQQVSKPTRVARLALMLAAVALSAGPLLAADAPNAEATPNNPDVAAAPAAPVSLTGPTREVVKLSVSGVSEDVIKAYVYHSPSTFNLSADSIIHLKAVGVTPDVLAAMLNRDTMLRDQAMLNARTGAPAPMVQPTAPPPAPVATAPAVDYSATTVAPAPSPYYYYPDYTYDYPYPYYYPYGYYGYYGWGVGHRWGWGYGPRFGGGFGRGRGGVQPLGGGHFSGGGRGGGGVGRH